MYIRLGSLNLIELAPEVDMMQAHFNKNEVSFLNLALYSRKHQYTSFIEN